MSERRSGVGSGVWKYIWWYKTKEQAEKQIKKVTAGSKGRAEKDKGSTKELEQLQQKQAEQEEELPWNMVLVNSSHPMTEGYVPELTEVWMDI